MSMNKKIFLFIIALFSFFIVNKSVYAANCDNYACAKCVYKTNDWKFEYDLSSDGDGTANLTFNSEKLSQERISYKFEQSLVSQNFISEEKNVLVCPSKLYYSVENGGATGNTVTNIINIYQNQQTKKILNNETIITKVISLDSSSSNNNKKLSSSGSNNNLSCSKEVSYGQSGKVKVTVTLVNDSFKYEFDDANFKVGTSSLKKEDFSNGCPAFYVSCGANNNDGFCSFSMTNDFGVRDYKASNSSKNTEIGECGEGYVKDSSGNCGACRSGYYRYGTQCLDRCPEGTIANDGKTCEKKAAENVANKPCQDNDIKRVFRLFGYLLLVAKILIPLIIIIMGTFDIFKAVYGQDDKALGKQLRILVWRIVGGLTIFFLPTIVGAFFKISSDLKDVTEKEDYKICANCLLDPLNGKICSVNENEQKTTTTTQSRVQGTGGTASETGGSGYSGGGTGGGSR